MQTNRFWLGRMLFAAVVCVVFCVAGQAIAATVSGPTVGCTTDVFVSDQVWEDGGEEGGGSYDVRTKSDADAGVLGASSPLLSLYDGDGNPTLEGQAASTSGIGVNPVVSVQTFLEAPGPGGYVLDSHARATNVLAWTPTSETLDDEDNIWVEFTIGLDGSLESSGNAVPSAKAGFGLDVSAYSLGGSLLSSLGGEATIEDTWYVDGGSPVNEVVFAATGDLDGKFSWDGDSDTDAVIDDEFKLRFQGQIGETYLIEIGMESSLYEAELSESLASSKFGNTLTYEFTAAYDPGDTGFQNPLTDVSMVAVPEPATLGLLVIGGTGVLWRKRTDIINGDRTC